MGRTHGREGPLPTFVGIGAQKAGTTSLYEYLRAQPRVVMADPKEVNFFAMDDLWAKGPSFYRRHFRADPDARAVGEISPSYAMAHLYPHTARRLAFLLPETRIIYLVRDPVERIISAYRHHLFIGQERRDPRVAVTDDPRYLDASSYGRQLRRYLDRFPPEQVLVCAAERLRVDRVLVMTRILGFIGVTDAVRPGSLDRLHHPTAPKRMPYWHLHGPRRRGFVERPFLPPDRRPAPLRRCTTRPFPDLGVLFPPPLRRELRERLCADAADIAGFVGAEEFRRWGWSVP